MAAAWTGFEIGWVARACGGRVVGDPRARAAGFERDSRGTVAGAIYVAIRGERHDGHSFLRDVARAGAAAAIVEAGRWNADDAGGMALVEVRDTIAAIAEIARAHRRRIAPTVLALTGSCGKTSTKEILASMLRGAGSACATQGNLNNHIGVPFTLLDLREGDRFAVVEMGCNHAGEIAALTAIAEPDVAAITCVGAAHLEWLGTLEGVARAKGELFLGLHRPGAVAVVNVDDPLVAGLPIGGARRLTAGERPGADVRLVEVEPVGDAAHRLRIDLPSGAGVSATLRMPGRHQALNAAVAAAMAHAAGATADAIAAGIEAVSFGRGRGRIIRGPLGVTVLDDTYNANPTSTTAALATLAALPGTGRKVAVLGEMLELGEAAEAGHRSVGEAAVGVGGVGLLLCVGPHARAMVEGATSGGLPGDRALAFGDVATLLDALGALVAAGDRVLVKGSRGMRMERAVDRIVGSGADAV